MIHSQRISTRESHGSIQNERQPEGAISERPISVGAWIVLAASALATFFAFWVLDPNPSLVLSICTAANVAIMLWAIYRLYQWDLLLSPIMIIFIGPTMIMYYSWGNLGVRMAGEAGYARNIGTLGYYPLAALLSTISLILYCWIVFSVFQKAFRQVKVKYQDLSWTPLQAIVTIILCLAVLVYLSRKYDFLSGYFINATSNLDRWLSATIDSFVFLVVVVNISVLAKATNLRDRLIGLLGVILAVGLTIGLRSRTFMIMVLVLFILCWLTLKPKHARLSLFLPIGLIGILVFVIGSAVKGISSSGTTSIIENLLRVSQLRSTQILAMSSAAARIDTTYRLGGFELPAVILRCLDLGAPPAYGEAFSGALLQGLPGFLRPPGIFSERSNIVVHYHPYCIFRDDVMAVPMVSGLADWDIPGVFISIVFGLFSLLLWRIAQISPRFFLAYLLVPSVPDNLFWSGVFTYVKTMVFLWLILWIMGFLLMPRWLSSTGGPVSNELPIKIDVPEKGNMQDQNW
jgi:hypothetical protein